MDYLKEWNERGYWLASLSTGHTIKEPDLFESKKDKSPWVKLMEYIKSKEGLYITNLKYCLRGRMYNLPSRSNKPFKFARGETKKPIGYNYFVTVFSEANPSIRREKSGSARRLEAHYEDYKVCLYIDNISGESWVTIEDGDNTKVF
jgi:hypothetical protein